MGLNVVEKPQQEAVVGGPVKRREFSPDKVGYGWGAIEIDLGEHATEPEPLSFGVYAFARPKGPNDAQVRAWLELHAVLGVFSNVTPFRRIEGFDPRVGRPFLS
jgi:hypothetical protein